KGDESEVARIVAAFDRYHTYRLLHGRIHNADDSRRELLDRAVRAALCQPCGHDFASALQVEAKLSPKKAFRLQTAEYEVGIGNGRLDTPPVADRTGISSGRFRAAAQRS